MIYGVFILIVAAAAIYLFFSENRHTLQQPPINALRQQINERRHVIRLSLSDIEYEKSVGKMDEENFLRLQSTLLSEWEKLGEELEKLPAEVAKPAADSCPACKAVIPLAGARFCPSCGHRLMQIIAALLFFVSLAAGDSLSAFDIHVTLKNGTTNEIHTSPLSVQLLKLEQGMQPVSAQNSTAGRASFSGLPAPERGPYMLKVDYRGVTYFSRAIPPKAADPAEVTLEIFERTTDTASVRIRTLVDVRRVDKTTLAGLMIVFFINNGNRAFAPQGGLSFFLPPAAVIEQASISVGSGASDIKWLKLNAEKKGAPGYYTIGQSIKPGERILQIMFRMPYAEAGTATEFRALYPQDTGLQFMAEPEDITVKSGEKTLPRIRDANLGRGLISFTPRDKTVNLTLAGGSIAPPQKNEEVEIVVRSPLELWQKLVFPFVALAIFAGIAVLRARWRPAGISGKP